MINKVEVIIQPITLRFSLFDDEIYYLFSGSTEAQLDKAEEYLGIDPRKVSIMDSNLGFLPVASTVLIRGEKNILFDPNNHHIGFYGLLSRALKIRGLTFRDIDVVVVSHWHHDHSSNAGLFGGGKLVVGKGELDYGREVYGEEEVRGKTKNYAQIAEIDDVYEICNGVKALYTPGHTPGSICILVEDGDERIAIMGDSIMTKQEWLQGKYSHWYSQDQKDGLEQAKELIHTYNPTIIIPGHDRMFSI